MSSQEATLPALLNPATLCEVYRISSSVYLSKAEVCFGASGSWLFLDRCLPLPDSTITVKRSGFGRTRSTLLCQRPCDVSKTPAQTLRRNILGFALLNNGRKGG